MTSFIINRVTKTTLLEKEMHHYDVRTAVLDKCEGEERTS